MIACAGLPARVRRSAPLPYNGPLRCVYSVSQSVGSAQRNPGRCRPRRRCPVRRCNGCLYWQPSSAFVDRAVTCISPCCSADRARARRSCWSWFSCVGGSGIIVFAFHSFRVRVKRMGIGFQGKPGDLVLHAWLSFTCPLSRISERIRAANLDG